MRIFPARSGSNSINSSGKQFRTKSTTKILPQLTESFSSVIGKTRWNLQASAEVSEAMTVLFSYPNALSTPHISGPKSKSNLEGAINASKPFAVAHTWLRRSLTYSQFPTSQFLFSIANERFGKR